MLYYLKEYITNNSIVYRNTAYSENYVFKFISNDLKMYPLFYITFLPIFDSNIIY